MTTCSTKTVLWTGHGRNIFDCRHAGSRWLAWLVIGQLNYDRLISGRGSFNQVPAFIQTQHQGLSGPDTDPVCWGFVLSHGWDKEYRLLIQWKTTPADFIDKLITHQRTWTVTWIPKLQWNLSFSTTSYFSITQSPVLVPPPWRLFLYWKTNKAASL